MNTIPAGRNTTILRKQAVRNQVRSLIRKNKFIYFLMLPGLIYYLLFAYIPMTGIVIAFQDFKPWYGIAGSEWVGFLHFQHFFESQYFIQLLRNTVVIYLLKLIFGFPFPIIFALLLNELRGVLFKKIVQTVTYFPHFLSWAVVAALLVNMLSTNTGLINKMIAAWGYEPINFLADQAYFYPMIVFSEIWKSFGWGSILYLAAIAGIDQQLYEAARIDGAGKLRQIWHVTLPSISYVIFMLLILSVGDVFGHMFNNDFLQLISLVGNKSFLWGVGDTIDTYVFRGGLQGAQYSYGAAIGLFKGLLGLGIVIAINRIGKKLDQPSVI